MKLAIKIMRGVVWIMLLLSALYVLDVAKNVGFYGVFDFLTFIPIVLIFIPIFILYFTSHRFSPVEENKLKLVVLAIYILVALSTFGFMFYALTHV